MLHLNQFLVPLDFWKALYWFPFTTYFNIFHFRYIVSGSIFFRVGSIWTCCTFCKLHFSWTMYFTVLHFYKIKCVSDIFKMLAVIVCFTSLKFMVLKALVRTSSFPLIKLFYNVSFIFCCIFLRHLGKHLFLRLDKTVYQFTLFLFWISYCIFIV